jgi:hypothetical protein
MGVRTYVRARVRLLPWYMCTYYYGNSRVRIRVLLYHDTRVRRRSGVRTVASSVGVCVALHSLILSTGYLPKHVVLVHPFRTYQWYARPSVRTRPITNSFGGDNPQRAVWGCAVVWYCDTSEGSRRQTLYVRDTVTQGCVCVSRVV